MSFQPLRITARLAGAFVAADPWSPMLDAVLGYQELRERLGPRFFEQDPHRDGLIETELPLERRGSGENWYWACSGPQYRELGQFLRRWHKRFDDALALDYADAGKLSRINNASGRYKNWRVPLLCRLAEEITWHAVGDAAEVRRLLLGVTHLGKKASQGMGQVLGWTVEPADVDGSEALAGIVTRPLPWAGSEQPPEGAYLGYVAIRPPYWWHPHRRLCSLPGSKIC